MDEKRLLIVKKIYIPSLIVSLLIFSCKKEKTTWNSDWVLPIVNDTLSLNDMVNDSTINIGTADFYEVDLTRTILDLGIEDVISIPDTLISHTFNSTAGSLNVPPGFSIVNEIEEHSIDMSNIQLKKIRVSKGTISMKVYNPVGTKTFFTIELPGVTKAGVVFQEQYVVEAGSTTNPGTETAILDISGYDIDLTGVSGGDYNLLQSRLIIKTDPSGPPITLLNSHIFKVDAEFKSIKIDYARGYFGNVSFTDTSNYIIDFLNTIAAGSIDLPATLINFEISNGLKVDAKAIITTVSNTNYNGNTVNLSNAQIGSPIYLGAATGSWSSLVNTTESLEFNGVNSNIENYLENLGNTHTVGYKIELNPWGNTTGGWNEIFPNSRFKVKLNAQMPLSIGADGLTLRDTFDFNISQDFEKSHIESGTLVLNATNAFPFSSSVKLYFMDENDNVMHIVLGTSEIRSSLYGSIDPQDGKQKMNSEVLFILTDEMLSDLNIIKKVAVESTFNTPDPATSLNQQVNIPVGAFIAVKLKTKFNLKAVL